MNTEMAWFIITMNGCDGTLHLPIKKSKLFLMVLNSKLEKYFGNSESNSSLP